MRRLTVPSNALAISSAGERRERALDRASMPADPCEVDVVTCVPPIDGQLTCELVDLVHSVLVTRGYDVRPAWDHADRVDVSTRSPSGHKHVA